MSRRVDEKWGSFRKNNSPAFLPPSHAMFSVKREREEMTEPHSASKRKVRSLLAPPARKFLTNAVFFPSFDLVRIRRLGGW